MNSQSLLENEAICRIEQLGGIYDPESPLSVYDQLLACESIAESTPVTPDDEDGRIILGLKDNGNSNGSVNGNVNGSCKRSVKFELTQSKRNVITELNASNFRTPPREIARLLEQFFIEYPSHDGHWLYIAQHWTPRTIIRVLNNLIKLDSTGRITVINPAGYFTYLIKFRKRRRNL